QRRGVGVRDLEAQRQQTRTAEMCRRRRAEDDFWRLDSLRFSRRFVGERQTGTANQHRDGKSGSRNGLKHVTAPGKTRNGRAPAVETPMPGQKFPQNRAQDLAAATSCPRPSWRRRWARVILSGSGRQGGRATSTWPGFLGVTKPEGRQGFQQGAQHVQRAGSGEEEAKDR